MSTRRGFLASILAAGYAPAAVGSGILMPVRPLVELPAYRAHISDVALRWVDGVMHITVNRPMTLRDLDGVFRSLLL